MKIPENYLSRQDEITQMFMKEMNKHVDDFMAGKVEEMFQLKDITNLMFLHPVHVTNVIKLNTGFHPCHFYELRLVSEAKTLLADFSLSIGSVASRLTYDKSNFTKFFKQYAGTTPSNYRKALIDSTQS